MNYVCIRHDYFIDGGWTRLMLDGMGPPQTYEVAGSSSTEEKPYSLVWQDVLDFYQPHLNESLHRDMHGVRFTTSGLHQRLKGPLASLETGDFYQDIASRCVDEKPSPYSIRGMMCGVVLNFGIK